MLEAVTLVMSVLTKLEVGRMVVPSFGATTESVRGFDDELPMCTEDGGPRLGVDVETLQGKQVVNRSSELT